MAVPESSFTVDDPGAGVGSQYDQNKNTTCQRTGFKIKVKEGLAEEWNGALVRHESFEYRNIQDFVRPEAEVLTGAIRPEGADVFITTTVISDDL